MALVQLVAVAVVRVLRIHHWGRLSLAYNRFSAPTHFVAQLACLNRFDYNNPSKEHGIHRPDSIESFVMVRIKSWAGWAFDSLWVFFRQHGPLLRQGVKPAAPPTPRPASSSPSQSPGRGPSRLPYPTVHPVAATLENSTGIGRHVQWIPSFLEVRFLLCHKGSMDESTDWERPNWIARAALHFHYKVNTIGCQNIRKS